MILHFYKVQTHVIVKTATDIIHIQEYLQMDHTSSMLIKIPDVPTWWHVLYQVNNEHIWIQELLEAYQVNKSVCVCVIVPMSTREEHLCAYNTYIFFVHVDLCLSIIQFTLYNIAYVQR